jgi:hypothetical protein
MNTKLTVRVSREGKWWVGEVPEVLGAATEVTQLSDLEVEIRDLLAGLLDLDDDDLELSWDMSEILGSEGQEVWDAYRRGRDELEIIKAKVESDRTKTLHALRSAGVSIRDTATLVGLSHQRVAQLLNS